MAVATGARRATAAEIAVWLAVVVAVCALSVRGWGAFQLGAYQDDAVYAVLAHSIAAGEPYGLVSRPAPAPPPPKYPFALPLVLAPVAALFPDRPEALATVSLAATLGSVSLLFWCWPWLSPGSARGWGLATAALYGLAPLVIEQTRMVMSEPLFTMLGIAALALAERCAVAPRVGWASPLGLGLVLMLVGFTRSIGAVLWAACLLRIAWRGGARAPALLAATVAGGVGSLALVLALTGIDAQHLVPQQYAEELSDGRPVAGARPAAGDRIRRAVEVAAGYGLDDVRRVVVPLGGGRGEQATGVRLGVAALPAIVGLAVTILVVLGFARAAGTSALAPSVLGYQAGYLALLAVWPWHLTRLVLPLQPWLAFQFALGAGVVAAAALRRAAPQRRARARRAASVAAVAILLALSAWRSARIQDSRAFSRDLRIGAQWLAAHSAPDAVVMARYPEAVFLHARRRVMPVPPHASRADLPRELRAARVDYVLIAPRLVWSRRRGLDHDEQTRTALLPALDDMVARGDAEVVYDAPAEMVRVYRVSRR